MARPAVVGMDNVLANLNAQVKGIKGRTHAGLLAAALYAGGESQKLAPVVTSNLKNSEYVISTAGRNEAKTANFKEPGAKEATQRHGEVIAARGPVVAAASKGEFPRAEIGYSAVYAAAVHENPRSGKTGGMSPQGVPYAPPKGSKRKMYSTVGQWKFVEVAVQRNAAKIVSIIKDFAEVK